MKISFPGRFCRTTYNFYKDRNDPRIPLKTAGATSDDNRFFSPRNFKISRTFALAFCLFLLSFPIKSLGKSEMFELTLQDAEDEALKTSSLLKSYTSDAEASIEQANSQYAALLPKITLEGSYEYLGQVPVISIPGIINFPFGSHWLYSIGPVLRYTLWDTGAARNAYEGIHKFADSRLQDRKNAELQLLHTVRSAYLKVQLLLEEMRLVNESLELSRAQGRDISIRYRAGSATRLDLVTSHRDIISYELQFKQKQAELSAALKDLLALIAHRTIKDVLHPGPKDVAEVSLVLNLDSLKELLDFQGQTVIVPPDDQQPMLLGQELLAQSSELSAASQKAQLFPSLQFSARTSLDYPNGPIPEQINQNTVSVTVSMPLFEGDHTKHLEAENLKEAEAARNRKDQLRIDLQRDFSKAQEMLESLRDQQKIAAEDVLQSEEATRLYYESYKGGKINLIDVQSANLRALESKVNKTRIDAQILDQIYTLKALSGREIQE